jgi:hypothetical protein
MLKAGALFVAVTISFVIAVLISLLITLAFQYKIQNRQNLLQKKLERNANSAIVLLMNNTAEETTEESKIIDLYEEESDSVKIKTISWGVFKVATVKAFSGRYSLTKTVEFGYKPDETLSGAVYLTDLSRPLNLCGKTKITGNCYLPEAGVKRGYIEGKSFEGSTLINGTIKNSKNSLPPLNKDITKKLSDVFGNSSFQSGLYKEVSLSDKDTLINSFLDTTMLIRVNGDITILSKFLSGNIIVYATQSLTIDQSSKLEDITLFARDIKIKTGFSGNIQAFATDSIIVEENCKLNYPSALGLFKKDHKTQQPFIKLLKNSEVDGIVFTCQSEFVSDQSQTLVSLDKGAILKGQLYVDGFADIKGEVDGMVWCNKFLLKTASSIYENHLLDAVIDRTKLSTYYIGSGLIASGKKKNIIKWLE